MSLEIEMQDEQTVAKNEIYAFRCPILCNESLKYKIEIIGLSSSEVMGLEIMRQRLILHMRNPELEISMLLFIINYILWNIFALPFNY